MNNEIGVALTLKKGGSYATGSCYGNDYPQKFKYVYTKVVKFFYTQNLIF